MIIIFRKCPFVHICRFSITRTRVISDQRFEFLRIARQPDNPIDQHFRATLFIPFAPRRGSTEDRWSIYSVIINWGGEQIAGFLRPRSKSVDTSIVHLEPVNHEKSRRTLNQFPSEK